jgi:hypothetical protein
MRDGLLEEVSVTLPWTESFAAVPGGALTLDNREELDLTVGGQARVARLRGLAPGRYLIGLRAAWPGPGVLVLRPVTGDNVHIIPMVAAAQTAARELDELRARRDAAASDLAARESGTAQLAAELSAMLPVLAAWSTADQDLVEGLRATGFAADGSALDHVRNDLADIKRRLTGLDEVLGPLLAAHAQAYEEARKVRPY